MDEENQPSKPRDDSRIPEIKSPGKEPFRGDTVTSLTRSAQERGRAVTTIRKESCGQARFSGLYNYELENVAEIYANIADMCDATRREKRKAMYVMLQRSAFSLFTSKGKGCTTFEEGITLLASWFNGKDKPSRLLCEWHAMSLYTVMEAASNESEVEVFRGFVSRIMSLKHQLHAEYRTDKNLRDRLENVFLINRRIPEDKKFAVYTEQDVRAMHQTFGHPSIKTTKGRLLPTIGGQMDAATCRSIEKTSAQCRNCARYATAPRRLRLTVGADDLKCKQAVKVDKMFLHGNDVVHMLDVAMHFCATTFVKCQSANEIMGYI